MKLLLLRKEVAVIQLYNSVVSMRSLLVFALAVSLAPAHAETTAVPLAKYLSTMDRAEVSFSGRIKYDSREDDFTFYNENREPFGVTVDAGRDARELIEADCENSSFMVTYTDLCTISGSGTVEIRGSRVFISIETVETIGK